ncbi:MAG: RNA polymerase sigma-54 factor [Firmicutes bacterium HGW-Firmicutes-12]|nr:MAG: RNA polymerase sigma-54 factor [Firmicutes bacterium HGW-Firmicutes-12]
MQLNYGLRLEQSQKLIMTPELRQAIKILQLSFMELSDYVDQMVTENPLIEIKEEKENNEYDKKETEIDWEYYLNGNYDSAEPRQYKEIKPEVPFEGFMSKGISLDEHLYSQLGYLALNKTEYRIASYLIGNMNPCGYIYVSSEQAAADLKVSVKQVEKAIRIIQGFDPSGVGASSLSECLIIQLKQKGFEDSVLYELVTNHLELIAAGKLNQAAQKLNVPVARIQEMADLIKTLNPKPGASYGCGDIRYIVPDVTVERIEDDFVIYLNDNHIPTLTINKVYSSILKKSNNADDSTRDFVESKLHQALWLIRSIEQRRMTIYQVTNALVKTQRPFFMHGIKYLKPLTLKQIAEQINVHESTVSRATDNKYIQTPQGIYDFKFFFSSGLQTDSGESASSESIKRLLQEIIKEEEPTKPYSDQKISNIIQGRGISIARRTVAKYREEIGIPNAGFRKRYS